MKVLKDENKELENLKDVTTVDTLGGLSGDIKYFNKELELH